MLYNYSNFIHPILMLGILSNFLLGRNVDSSKVLVDDKSDPTTTKKIASHPLNKKIEIEIGEINKISNDKSCSDIGDILVYAETQNYVTYICGNRKEPTKTAYFKAKSKNNRNELSIIGKASLGWGHLAFVGINGDYTYSMDIFPVNILATEYHKPSLHIYPFSAQKSTLFRQYDEELTKYISIDEFKQAKNLGFYWLTQEADPAIEGKKSKFIKYLSDNKEKLKLKVCEIPPRAEEEVATREGDSKLYKFDDRRYLLEYRCNRYLRYASYNFFLFSEQPNGLEIKFLTVPKILKDFYRKAELTFEDGIIFGRPLYDPKSKTLYIRQKTSFDNGGLLTLAIINDQFELVEYRFIRKNENLYILDPFLYPIWFADSNWRSHSTNPN